MKRAIDPAELRPREEFSLTEHGRPYTLHGIKTSPTGVITTLRGMKPHFNHPVDIIVLRGEKVWVEQ